MNTDNNKVYINRRLPPWKSEHINKNDGLHTTMVANFRGSHRVVSIGLKFSILNELVIVINEVL